MSTFFVCLFWFLHPNHFSWSFEVVSQHLRFFVCSRLVKRDDFLVVLADESKIVQVIWAIRCCWQIGRVEKRFDCFLVRKGIWFVGLLTLYSYTLYLRSFVSSSGLGLGTKPSIPRAVPFRTCCRTRCGRLWRRKRNKKETETEPFRLSSTKGTIFTRTKWDDAVKTHKLYLSCWLLDAGWFTLLQGSSPRLRARGSFIEEALALMIGSESCRVTYPGHCY